MLTSTEVILIIKTKKNETKFSNNNPFITVEFPYDILITLLDKMAQIQVRLAAGSSENIQLTALISAFYFARDITPSS